MIKQKGLTALLMCVGIVTAPGAVSAAPVPQPTTECGWRKFLLDRCEANGRAAFATCFSDSQTISAGQAYCIRTIIGDNIPALLGGFGARLMSQTPEPAVSEAELAYSIAECSSAYTQPLETDAYLTITYERIVKCYREKPSCFQERAGFYALCKPTTQTDESEFFRTSGETSHVSDTGVVSDTVEGLGQSTTDATEFGESQAPIAISTQYMPDSAM